MSTRRSRIVVIGDSHAAFGYGGVAEAEIYWLGPMTMHRVARDGLFRAYLSKRRWINWSTVDWAVLSFGEIDCRAHFKKIADATERSVFEVSDDLAARFVHSVSRFTRHTNLAISCVIPPGMPWLDTTRYPDAETALVEQVAIRRRLNARLAEEGRSAGISFVDFYDSYSLDDGTMNPERSDGILHVDYYNTEPIAAALAGIVKRPLSYRKPEGTFDVRARETRAARKLRRSVRSIAAALQRSFR